MDKELNDLRLRQMSEVLAQWQEIPEKALPGGGWLRAIRQALGMSVEQLGTRLGVSRQGVAAIERREIDRSVTLATLDKAAEAMGARVVYAIVPRTSLAGVRRQQAHRRAVTEFSRVVHSMQLEAQDVSSRENARQLAVMEEKLLSSWSRSMWDEEESFPPKK